MKNLGTILVLTATLAVLPAIQTKAQDSKPAFCDSIKGMRPDCPPPSHMMQPGDSLHRPPMPPQGCPCKHGEQGMMPGKPGGHGPGMPPGGFGGPGMNHKQEGTVSAQGIDWKTGEKSVQDNTFTSDSTDENAVRATGGTLSLRNCTINKRGGDSSDGDATSFYGVNAAALATSGGVLNISGGTINTNATGSNGIVAYGGTANVENTIIRCTKNLSRGIHATGGGTITANNLDIETRGNNSSVIATDRGGGTVTVNGGVYKTYGQDCAVCYSTGNITVNNIEGYSDRGEVGVIEGDNEININNCQMTSGDNRRGMMILQSGSGDAEGYNGRINVNGGSITLTSDEAPLVEITTTTQGTVTLKDVKLTVPSGTLMLADYNKRWNTTSPTAHLVLSTDNTCTYDGNVVADEYATATVTVDKNVTWNGAFNTAGTAKASIVTVNGTWNLTADSNVDSLVLGKGAKVNKNGFKLNVKN